jgi:hypothetical protein
MDGTSEIMSQGLRNVKGRRAKRATFLCHFLRYRGQRDCRKTPIVSHDRPLLDSYTLDFQQIDGTQLALVGGKVVNLGEHSWVEGIRVPDDF